MRRRGELALPSTGSLALGSLALGSLALTSLAMGVAGCTPASRVASAGSATVALSPAGTAEIDALCALPLETRHERARALALAGPPHTRSDRDVAIERWSPRSDAGPATPVGQAERAYVLDEVRRVMSRCLERDASALTQELVAFQTVAAIAPPSENVEHARMAAFLEAWGARHGLTFRRYGENDAWELELAGRGPERRVRWLVHGDVVPVNDPPTIVAPDAIPEGWHFPPFSAAEVQIETASALPALYGRGTEDDKGPMAAILVALATLSSAGLVPDGPLVLAIGTAEEEDWSGMRRYAEQAAPSRHTISVDAEFPVVVAQSGFVAWGLRIPSEPASPRPPRGRRAAPRREAALVALRGGLFLTQVPDTAEMELAPLAPTTLDALEARASDACAAELASRDAAGAFRAHDGFDAEVTRATREGQDVVLVRARGVSAHSSRPEDGRNANELLAAIASRLSIVEGPGARLLALVHAFFDRDLHGVALGVAHEDAFMGPLVVAPTVLRLDEQGARVEVNMRRPAGRTVDEFRADLDAALARVRARIGEDVEVTDDVFVSDVHHAETAGPEVARLVEVLRAEYAERTGLPLEASEARSIRGGTYARLFPGAVDFGPAMPEQPYTGHGADEHITLEALAMVGRGAFETAITLAFEP